MKTIAFSFIYILLTVSLCGQTHTTNKSGKMTAHKASATGSGKRMNDRIASGYYGAVKTAIKITWKNAPDSLLHTLSGFDAIYAQAKDHIMGHYTDFETYLRQYEQSKNLSAKIVEEEFDSIGNSLHEQDLVGTDMLNIDYQYTPAKENKRMISGLCNRGGKKLWGGYLTWENNNARIQDMAMNDLFVMHVQINIEDSFPKYTKSQLKIKDAFVIDAETKLLSKTDDREIWWHKEITIDLHKHTENPPTIDTIRHQVLARDKHGNIAKEIVTHSFEKEPTELVFFKYEYYE